MAKIVLLPAWLVESLTGEELLQFIVSDKPELFISSKEDLINYHAAQIEFFKYNFLGLYNTLDTEKLNLVFQHPLPNIPELHIYYEGKCDSEVGMHRLFQAALPENHTYGFKVKMSSCGTVTYVMGTTAHCHQTDDDFISVEDRTKLSREIMRSCFNAFQVQDGNYDMGRPFRNHPLQSQLYLSNLMHRT